MRTLFLIIVFASLMVSCSSTRNISSNSHYICEVVLSESHPEDDFIYARLIDIAKDGTTTIEVIGTGEKLTAAPGGYFVSSAYGTMGLKLLSVSADNKEAWLLRAWAEIE